MADKLIRGSTDLKLSPEGREQIRFVATCFRKIGGFWRVYTSSQKRAVETAAILAGGSEYTQLEKPLDSLTSWCLGGYEGQPVDKVLKSIQDLVANRPWVVPPGMGEKSTKVGESFNAFKARVLDEVRRLMDLITAHPGKKIGVVTHFHDIQLIRAWLAKYHGEPGTDSNLYDARVYNTDNGYPGEVLLLHKVGVKWLFDPVNVTTMKSRPGLYFVRHGATAWN